MSPFKNLFRRAEATVDTAESRIRNNRAYALEERMRKERGFNEVEGSMPKTRRSPAPDDRPTLTDKLLSTLGTKNPLSHPISAHDTLWLFDNTAYRTKDSTQWQAEFVASVLDQNTGLEVTAVVADIAEKLGLGKGNKAEATIRHRLMPFMQSLLPGRVAEVKFDGQTDLKLGPGGVNAISSDIKAIPAHSDGDIVTSSAVVPQGTDGILQMKTVYAEPTGWGVISGTCQLGRF